MVSEYIRVSAMMLPESEQQDMAYRAFERTLNIILDQGIAADNVLAGLHAFTKEQAENRVTEKAN